MFAWEFAGGRAGLQGLPRVIKCAARYLLTLILFVLIVLVFFRYCFYRYYHYLWVLPLLPVLFLQVAFGSGHHWVKETICLQ